MVQGNIHSIQSMGTLDGPGVRYVVFLQGCNLRCGCCHNPDTWEYHGGQTVTAKELVKKALRFREYFGEKGGVTLTGGEPLLQAEFVRAVFGECHEKGIHTCLDTSGSIWNEAIIAALEETDRVLLDIKYTDEESYLEYVGCSMEKPLAFLDYLNQKQIPTTIRQVIIPGLNDSSQSIAKLKEIIAAHPVVDQVELLPFKKLCQVKYDALNQTFRFADIKEPTPEQMKALERQLDGWR